MAYTNFGSDMQSNVNGMACQERDIDDLCATGKTPSHCNRLERKSITQETIASDGDDADLMSSDGSWEGDGGTAGQGPWARQTTYDALEEDAAKCVATGASPTSDDASDGSGPRSCQDAESDSPQQGIEADSAQQYQPQQHQHHQPQQMFQFIAMPVMSPYPQASMNFGREDMLQANNNGFTVMVRNVPNKYSRDLFVRELNDTGFGGAFDFLYLPIDPVTRANKGYAFVNFSSTQQANIFMNMYDNREMCLFGSDKRISVSPAVLQGFEANYAHYSNKFVNQQDESLRPLFLREVEPRAWQQVAAMKFPQAKKKNHRFGTPSLIDQAVQQHAQNRAGFHGTPFPATNPNVLANGASSPPQVRFCTFCGAKVEDTFRFCQTCGHSILRQ